jgi:serine/threonine protein kinase
LHTAGGAQVAIYRQNRVGSYQLITLIRAGHACEIWKAQKGDEDPHVAVKLLRRGPHHDREQLAYLKHEFFVGHRLRHAGIVRYHEFGSDDEGTYLVMELFPFLNLKQRINEGAERIAYHAEKIIRESAEALGYLHQQGWIHCDVKPDNLLVHDEGTVKLIDFSLAQRNKGFLSRLISGRSKVRGTKSYMSPEQIRGKSVDPRSDIYSFGCVVFELVGGKLPFTGTSANELLTKHLRSRPPSLQVVNKNVDPAFAQLVARMIAKEPRERPESMGALLGELDRTPIFRRRPTPPDSQRANHNSR